MNRYESSVTACERLRINPQTLYAYVSRGLIATQAHPNDSRKRLYSSTDVDLLEAQQRKGRSRRAVATSTVDFGEPILRSKISRIADNKFFYRGQCAQKLANTATLEDIFQLLCCTKEIPQKRHVSDLDIVAKKRPFARIVNALTYQFVNNNGYGNKQHGYYLLLLLAANAANNAPLSEHEQIHQLLARSWATSSQGADLIRRALVLCADHELNASTYATRVTASAGGTLPACLLTGLSTLSGNLHGGLTDRCLHWMKTKSPLPIVDVALDTPPPGFGHRLYPNGDPRAAEIIKHCREPAAWRALRQHVTATLDTHPTLDYGLSLLEQVLALPKGSGFTIFAIGRTVGWLAHSFEQRKESALIRPRAYS